LLFTIATFPINSITTSSISAKFVRHENTLQNFVLTQEHAPPLLLRLSICTISDPNCRSVVRDEQRQSPPITSMMHASALSAAVSLSPQPSARGAGRLSTRSLLSP
jgi:hypothetical protein